MLNLRLPLPRLYGLEGRFLHLAGDLSVSQAFASHLGYHLGEAGCVGVLVAMVEAEYLLCDISIKVERLNRDVGSVQSALEARPEVLNSIGVDVAANIAVNVIDYLMHVRASNEGIGGVFIGDEVSASLHIVEKRGFHGRAFAIPDNASANLAAPLQHSHHDSLAIASGVVQPLDPLALVHVLYLAAYKGLIALYGAIAAEHIAVSITHGYTDAVQHEPCTLLGDAKIAGYLVGGNAVLAVGEHPGSHQPLVQPKG